MAESKFQKYRHDLEIPGSTLAWNMYAAGIANIGKAGKPESFAIPSPGDDQLLVRVDAVGLCFSDVKLIKLGGDHPKLYGRDLSKEPTRVGHEVALTVIKVGKHLAHQYTPGQRLAVQPDIYVHQRNTAYGYTIPGGLIQYHLLGPEVLDADDGAYVIPVDEQIGYAEAALTEPWACVDAAYTQRRRLFPQAGGIMWIMGNGDDRTGYTFSRGLDAPRLIYLTAVPEKLKEIVKNNVPDGTQVIETEDILPGKFSDFSDRVTGGKGFDDIILLSPTSGKLVGQIAKLIAFRGVLNIVATRALDGDSEIDAGRIHYHYTAYVGTQETDIAAAYGEERNRCELKKGGSALFIGAGGPMGQMHVQRAVEKKDGPAIIIATEVNQERAHVLERVITPLAQQNGRVFRIFNPHNAGQSLEDFLLEITGERGVDDAVVCVPVAALMQETAQVVKPEGMLMFFAGVPNGTFIEVNLSPVFLGNLQLTGTSGSKLVDQEMVLRKTSQGELNPNRSVAAIGGMNAARDGIEALMQGTFAGKIVIFPQIIELPLMSLQELKARYPEIGSKLGENDLWTVEAEQALINRFWAGSKNDG
ncbi:MAG: zinc-binding dehydrogenase [Chloroflexi bacterium]|nr:zinc-binding dehydrogenase [Chloroflexota bacterium]